MEGGRVGGDRAAVDQVGEQDLRDDGGQPQMGGDLREFGYGTAS